MKTSAIGVDALTEGLPGCLRMKNLTHSTTTKITIGNAMAGLMFSNMLGSKLYE